ncbi:MAG: hypothetical protein LBU17_02325 [Treponema sp.]|nr:hypothetical protein [Treponema sp.]
MDIVLPDGIVIENIMAMEIETQSDFDIIRIGDFALFNDHGNTVMSFRLPSSNTPIDFAKPE